QETRRDFLITACALMAAHSLFSAGSAFARGEETEKLRSASLIQIDRAFRDATRAQQVPGVVAMAASDGGVIYEGAFGSRHPGKGPAMSRDTVFRIGSMIKVGTTVAAMQLVEEGKIALDAPAPAVGRRRPLFERPRLPDPHPNAAARGSIQWCPHPARG